jgi:hypothetical protein
MQSYVRSLDKADVLKASPDIGFWVHACIAGPCRESFASVVPATSFTAICSGLPVYCGRVILRYGH